MKISFSLVDFVLKFKIQKAKIFLLNVIYLHLLEKQFSIKQKINSKMITKNLIFLGNKTDFVIFDLK